MKELIAHLYGLADGSIQPLNRGVGLCDEMRHLFPEYIRDVKIHFHSWGMKSEDWVFPVPHPHLHVTEAFFEDNLWGKDKYGDNRRDLCRHCAQQLELKYGKGE